MDLSVKYMGLELQSPIIVGSSGLTNKVSKIKELEKHGAGAVVLKSLFEEQINMEADVEMVKGATDYPEAGDYIRTYALENSINNYLELIQDVKKEVNIPIIASVNCIDDSNWLDFASKMEQAGADALEINVSLIPTNIDVKSADNEKVYFDIVEAVEKIVNIPIALKMSHYSAGLANLIRAISWTKKVDAFTLFNRYYQPDIDIEKMSLTSSGVFSSPEDISASLRWVAILFDKINTDMSASTGVHSGEDVVKQILAGATTVQMVSSLYQHGPSYLSTVVADLKTWMERHNFQSLDQFRGKVSYKNMDSAVEFERAQFMKYFSSHE